MSEILMVIADLCGVAGMGFFLFSEIKQLWKVIKTHTVKGISHSAYVSKFIAITFSSIMLALTALYMSLYVILAEGVIVVWVLYLMRRYRK